MKFSLRPGAVFFVLSAPTLLGWSWTSSCRRQPDPHVALHRDEGEDFLVRSTVDRTLVPDDHLVRIHGHRMPRNLRAERERTRTVLIALVERTDEVRILSVGLGFPEPLREILTPQFLAAAGLVDDQTSFQIVDQELGQHLGELNKRRPVRAAEGIMLENQVSVGIDSSDERSVILDPLGTKVDYVIHLLTSCLYKSDDAFNIAENDVLSRGRPRYVTFSFFA